MNHTLFFDYIKTIIPTSIVQAFTTATTQALHNLAHGDYDRWSAAIASMPAIATSAINLAGPAVNMGLPEEMTDCNRTRLLDNLMAMHPWRKGPFDLFGIYIDTEWRSDLKWARIEPHLAPLTGRRILDVGCGNGYYLFRMLAHQPALIVGIDPFLLYVMQFHAINRYLRTSQAAVLPLGVDDLPPATGCFDTVLSMGVIYHRQNPLEHLHTLAGQLRPGGQLVLETLIIQSDQPQILHPADRYAKMRNVWAIPSPPTAIQWLQQAGFTNIRLIDITPTTSAEQRKTGWMRFESLSDFIDPQDSSRTVEGHPAPIRAVFLAEKP